MISDEKVANLYNFKWLKSIDYFARVKPLLDSGRWSFTADGKIARKREGGAYVTPWVKVRRCPKRQCTRHHRVLFRLFGVIPRFCFDCYKVVVRPRSVVELFKLLEVFRGFPEHLACKCGLELRDYVPALYGGYVYSLGIDEGRELHRLVGDAVAEQISPDVPVILKRACTEFELEYGDSEKWRYRPGWRLCEQWVDDHFRFPARAPDQPDFVQVSVMNNWFRHAHGAGDMSYLILNGGEAIHNPSVTYKREGEEL
jgi:hypothetical protein